MNNSPATIIIGAVVALAVVVGGAVRLHQIKSRADGMNELRRLWRQKIEQLADDLSTDRHGLSFDDVMDYLDVAYWQDLFAELEKMPPGKRALQKAIEIVEKDGYTRGA